MNSFLFCIFLYIFFISCEVGFHPADTRTSAARLSNFCLENVCSCPNGKKVEGAACIDHNVIHCESCDEGYFLNDKKECEIKVCYCVKGVGAEGKLCPNHGNNACESCHAGAILTTSADGSRQTCPCDTGFRLSNDDSKCIENVCTKRSKIYDTYAIC